VRAGRHAGGDGQAGGHVEWRAKNKSEISPEKRIRLKALRRRNRLHESTRGSAGGLDLGNVTNDSIFVRPDHFSNSLRPRPIQECARHHRTGESARRPRKWPMRRSRFPDRNPVRKRDGAEVHTTVA
jgi:hypothetical protein